MKQGWSPYDYANILYVTLWYVRTSWLVKLVGKYMLGKLMNILYIKLGTYRIVVKWFPHCN